jgi:mono/diheme cytochrome c family protein
MRLRNFVGVVAVLAVSGVVSGFSRTLSAVQSISVWSGVYTTAQSDAGEKLYFARCATCHGDDLTGREQSPALAGSQFLDGWNGKDLRRLLDRIQTMPPADPKPLTPAEGLEVMAFLLRAAEMPSGSVPLPSDRGRLAEIRFEREKP